MVRVHTVAVLLVIALFLLSDCTVSGKLCRTLKARTAWKHAGGTFRKVLRTTSWIEYDNKGNAGSEFLEELKEGEQLVITNEARGISILLRSDLAGIRQRGEHNFQQLYGGGWMKMVDCTQPEKAVAGGDSSSDSEEL